MRMMIINGDDDKVNDDAGDGNGGKDLWLSVWVWQRSTLTNEIALSCDCNECDGDDANSCRHFVLIVRNAHTVHASRDHLS